MFGFVAFLAIAILFAVAGGTLFTLQANLALSLIYLFFFFWGVNPRNREGLPGVLGYIATLYSLVCLAILWILFYITSGQTLIQDLFTGFNIQILR